MTRTITTKGLKALMKVKERFVLVNVLDPEVYEDEHICGSINIPFMEVEHRAPGLLKKDETIIVHCTGPKCTASETVAERLVQMGYTDVIRYKGGIEEWKKAGYCLEGRAHLETV